MEFTAEIDHTLALIENEAEFSTAPIATVPGGVVRREFVRRFPYIVVFVETRHARRVIMIRRNNSDPGRWRSRL